MAVEIKAVRDEGVMAEGRIHFVFPAQPKDGASRALWPDITGGIWIKKGAIIPDQIIINMPKVEEEVKKEEKPKKKKKKEITEGE